MARCFSLFFFFCRAKSPESLPSSAWIYSVCHLAFFPGNPGQAKRFQIWNIQFFQNFHGLIRVTAHGTCPKPERHQADHCGNRNSRLVQKSFQFFQISVLILGKSHRQNIIFFSQFLCHSLYHREKIIGIGMAVKKKGYGFPFPVIFFLFPELRRIISGFQRKRIFQINSVFHGTRLFFWKKFPAAILPENQMHKRFHIRPGCLLPVIHQQKHIFHIPGDSKRQNISHHQCHPPHPVHFQKCTAGGQVPKRLLS